MTEITDSALPLVQIEDEVHGLSDAGPEDVLDARPGLGVVIPPESPDPISLPLQDLVQGHPVKYRAEAEGGGKVGEVTPAITLTLDKERRHIKRLNGYDFFSSSCFGCGVAEVEE